MSQLQLSYQRAGLGERQAATVLLSRFTFGARPGDVDRVLRSGLAAWVEAQLDGAADEVGLERRLAGLDAVTLSDADINFRYPSNAQLSAHIRRYHPGLLPPRDEPVMDFAILQARVATFRQEHGFGDPERELRDQLSGQKILRSVYAENQLRELLTDFWQNHFFVSWTSNSARPWILPLERDALRPNALGSFSHLLGAVAKHPATLQFHAGTAQGDALAPEHTALAAELAVRRSAPGADLAAIDRLAAAVAPEIAELEAEQDLIQRRSAWPKRGPNLEYARILLEHQTLGTDAFATADLEAVATLLTGWSVAPYGASNHWFTNELTQAQAAGYVRQGGFLFRADWHDAREQHAFGRWFSVGGLARGESLLSVLARRPETAQHLASKLAARFVSERPPQQLVNTLARRYLHSGGSIRAIFEGMVESPAFWRAAVQRSKIKTPVELVASALRATDSQVSSTAGLAEWVSRMGQPLYAYQAVEGVPERSDTWLDPAALLARINFARALASQEVPGVARPTGHDAATAPARLALTLAAPDFQTR